MIEILNHLIDEIETHLSDDVDVDQLAAAMGTTGYHARRMDTARPKRSDELSPPCTAWARVRYVVMEAPLRSQPQLRFRLTVEGNTPMDAQILERPAFRLIGHAARVPLLYEGANPHIQRHIESLPATEHDRLKRLSSTEPTGLLQVSDDVDPDYAEGSELTYLHGVAVEASTAAPDDLDAIEVEAGSWVVFRTSGEHPAALQAAYAASAAEWFPSNPWRLRLARRSSR